MEDTLGARVTFPCGIVSDCLNPCSNGRYSRRVTVSSILSLETVLILVLMEDTLGGLDAGKLCFRQGESSKTYKLELC